MKNFIHPTAMINVDEFIINEEGGIYIGANTKIEGRRVELGDMCYIQENVLIGGGGCWESTSLFKCGVGCLISSGSIINTNHPVIFGDNVGLSPGVKLYTHSHWQNILEGYTARFGPITVGDDAYITGDSIVVPNIKIGRGAMVCANSTVMSHVPDYKMVAGNPAKVIGEARRELSKQAKGRIVKRLLKELCEYMNDKFMRTAIWIDQDESGSEEIRVHYAWDEDTIFDLNTYEVKGPQDWITDEIRNFLRRRGIKFKPIYWRYGG